MNELFWNAYNSAVYKITSTYTWEPEAWQGDAISALPFISSNQGKSGALFAHLNWHTRTIQIQNQMWTCDDKFWNSKSALLTSKFHVYFNLATLPKKTSGAHVPMQH